MRRDEIKIFPGNVETHIQRLDQFPDPPAAVAQENSPPSPSRPPLEYTFPETGHRWRNTRWKIFAREMIGSVSNAMVLVAVLVVVVALAVPSLTRLSLMTIISVVVLLAPGILLTVHLINRWLRRS